MRFNSQMHKKVFKITPPLDSPSFTSLPLGKVETKIHIFTGDDN